MTTLYDFASNGKAVFGDGLGHIFIRDMASGAVTRFAYDGYDPAFCNNGAAVVFVDASRNWAWCCYLDGTGLYGLGVTGSFLATPQIGPNGLYVISNYDMTSGEHQVWAFFYGGTPTKILNFGWEACLSYTGEWIVASGHSSVTGYQIVRLDGIAGGGLFGMTWVTSPDGSGTSSARHPSLDGSQTLIAFEAWGLGISDIAIQQLAGGVRTYYGFNYAPANGYWIGNPSFIGGPYGGAGGHNDCGVACYFQSPGGNGIYSYSLPPAWGGDGTGVSIYGGGTNPMSNCHEVGMVKYPAVTTAAPNNEVLMLSANHNLAVGWTPGLPNTGLYLSVGGDVEFWTPNGCIWKTDTEGSNTGGAGSEAFGLSGTNGDLELWATSGCSWKSNTAGQTGAYLTIENPPGYSHHLILRSASGAVLWMAP